MNIRKQARQILLHGLFLAMAGLLWGFVANNVPYPRLGLVAHVQFMSNGTLVMVMGVLLLALPNRVGPKAATFMVVTAWLLWALVLSEVANAWWGTKEMLAIAAAQAGAKGGAPWQETVIKLTHIPAGLALATSWALLIAGFLRQPAPGVAARP